MDEEEFAFPILTVDSVVFRIEKNELQILLIERGFEPFKGMWALPGRYIAKNETSKQALQRVLIEKTGIALADVTFVEQPYAFDAPKRDPRGYAVTLMYIGLAHGIEPGKHPGMNNGQNPTFVSVNKLPHLAYDHKTIVDFALTHLRMQARTNTSTSALMPSVFTLSELQTTYECIFNAPLDKRNFRKKILSLGFVEETEGMIREGAHRPAQLYRFSPQTPHANTF
jgi:8-oxo-dGTP diphosphatase